MKELALAAILTTVTGGALAQGLDASLSGETINIAYQSESVGLLSGGADIEAGGFANRRGDAGVYGKFLAVGQQAQFDQPLQFGIGAKAMIADVADGENISGVGIGGRIGYVIPSRVNPVGVIFEGYIAPGATSFGDVDKISDLSGRVEVEMGGNSTVGYFGFRHMSSEYQGKVTDLDDNVHVGVKMRF